MQIFSGSIEWRPAFQVVHDDSGPVSVVRVHRSDLFFERWDKLENPLVEQAYGQWLDDWRPEIVHVHHWARLTTSLVRTARARGLPTVVTLHDLFASCPRYHRVKADNSFCTSRPGVDACAHCAPRWRFQGDEEIDLSLEGFVEDMADEVRAASAVVAPTAGHGRRVMDWLGLERPVVSIPPAGSSVPGPASRPLGDRVSTSPEPLRVGMFGHLHPLKGLEILLAAQAGLDDPQLLELHIWGEAPDEQTQADLSRAAGQRPVVWHGAYAPEDLAGAPVDVVALPSLCAESYSFTLDEAASLGVPIVATDLGALADRATDRVWLVPRGDVPALGAALQQLGAEPSTRQQMRAAPAPTHCDGAQHDAALRKVYTTLLAGARPPRQAEDLRGLALRVRAFRQREAGLAELLRSEGWEDVVAGLQERVRALEPEAGG